MSIMLYHIDCIPFSGFNCDFVSQTYNVAIQT